MSSLAARRLVARTLALPNSLEGVGQPLIRGLAKFLLWRLGLWLRLVPKLAIFDLFLYGLGLHFLLGVISLALFLLAVLVLVVIFFFLSQLLCLRRSFLLLSFQLLGSLIARFLLLSLLFLASILHLAPFILLSALRFLLLVGLLLLLLRKLLPLLLQVSFIGVRGSFALLALGWLVSCLLNLRLLVLLLLGLLLSLVLSFLGLGSLLLLLYGWLWLLDLNWRWRWLFFFFFFLIRVVPIIVIALIAIVVVALLLVILGGALLGYSLEWHVVFDAGTAAGIRGWVSWLGVGDWFGGLCGYLGSNYWSVSCFLLLFLLLLFCFFALGGGKTIGWS